MKNNVLNQLLLRASKSTTPSTSIEEIKKALIEEAKDSHKNTVRHLIEFALARKGNQGFEEIHDPLLVFCGETQVTDKDMEKFLNKSGIYREFKSLTVH